MGNDYIHVLYLTYLQLSWSIESVEHSRFSTVFFFHLQIYLIIIVIIMFYSGLRLTAACRVKRHEAEIHGRIVSNAVSIICVTV